MSKKTIDQKIFYAVPLSQRVLMLHETWPVYQTPAGSDKKVKYDCTLQLYSVITGPEFHKKVMYYVVNFEDITGPTIECYILDGLIHAVNKFYELKKLKKT